MRLRLIFVVRVVYAFFESLLALAQRSRQLRQLAAAEKKKDCGHDQNYDRRAGDLEQQNIHDDSPYAVRPASSSARQQLPAGVRFLEEILAPGLVRRAWI